MTLSIRMSEHETRYNSGHENSLSCHITWVQTQMTVAQPALICRSVLPKTITLSFITPFPWGISMTVLSAQRKAFSQNHFPRSQEKKNKRQNQGENIDQWKFLKQFPSTAFVFLDSLLTVITTRRKGQCEHLSGVSVSTHCL